MRYLILYISLIVCGAIFQSELKAQLLYEHLFSDSTRIAGFDELHDVVTLDDGFIISGSVIYPEWEEVMILRINEEGEVVWNSNAFKEVRIDKVLRFFDMIEDENYIYAACSYSDTGGGEADFWKLDKQTGEVIWINKYEFTESPYLDTLLDSDELSFLWIWNSNDEAAVSRISKIDGLEIQTTILEGFIPSGFQNAFATDRLGNLYAAYTGELTKYEAPDFQNVLWRQSIDLTIQTEFINRLYSDRMNNLFVFDDAVIHRLNPWTGERLWVSSLGIVSSNQVDAEILEIGDDLIFATRHSFVGSGSSDFELVRVNKSNGQAIFEVGHSMVGPYGSVSGTREGILSLALDCELNAYVTGYYGDENFGPANWGMMKIDGSNGDKIYEETFTNLPDEEDDFSRGKYIYVRDGVPTMLGEAEVSNGQAVHLATIDTTTNTAGAFLELDAGYRHESVTAAISGHEEDVYVLKELGKKLVAEKRTPQGELEWTREFGAETKLLNGFMSAHEDGVLVCYNISSSNLDTIPWYSSDMDSMAYVYLSRTDGTIIQDTTILSPYGPGETARSLQAIKDENSFFVFETSTFSNKVIKWNFDEQTLVSSSIFETMIDGEYELQPLVDFDANTILFLGSNSVRSLNKNTMNISVSLLWSSRPVRDVMQWGDTVYVAGNFSNDIQSLTAYRISTNTKLWEPGYTNPGSWFQVEQGANNRLYAVGLSDGEFRVSTLSRQSGAVIEDFYPQNPQWETLVPGAIEFLAPNHLVINATNERSDGSSEPVLLIVDMEEMELDYVWMGNSPSERKSKATSLLLDVNNHIWAGGSWYSAANPYAGYLNIFDFADYIDNADCPGDLNGDLLVNSSDLMVLLSNFGCTQDCSIDLNGNGVGDTADLIIWLSLGFGTCPQ